MWLLIGVRELSHLALSVVHICGRPTLFPAFFNRWRPFPEGSTCQIPLFGRHVVGRVRGKGRFEKMPAIFSSKFCGDFKNVIGRSVV
jgi:hypothetical protein